MTETQTHLLPGINDDPRELVANRAEPHLAQLKAQRAETTPDQSLATKLLERNPRALVGAYAAFLLLGTCCYVYGKNFVGNANPTMVPKKAEVYHYQGPGVPSQTETYTVQQPEYSSP